MTRVKKTGRVDFESLYQDSLQLTETIDDHGIPTLQRGISQLDAASKKLKEQVKRTSSDRDNDTLQKAHFLLAGQGFDADKLSRELNTIELKASYEPLETLGETDIEGYLRHHHDMIVVTAIEESKEMTKKACDLRMSEYLHKEWDLAKKQILEGFGYRNGVYEPAQLIEKHIVRPNESLNNFSSSLLKISEYPIAASSPSISSSFSHQIVSSMTDLMKQYSAVVHSLSTSRKQKQRKSSEKVVGAFLAAISENLYPGNVSSPSSITIRCWELLQCILHEDEQNLYEDEFSPDSTSRTSSSNVKFFLSGSLKYLEKQYRLYVEAKVSQTRADIGGVPGLIPIVQAWVKTLIETKEIQLNASTCFSSYHQRLPLWPQLYLCLRCGGRQEALEIVRESSIFSSSSSEFLEIENGQGLPSLREALIIQLAQEEGQLKQQKSLEKLSNVCKQMLANGEKEQSPYKYILLTLLCGGSPQNDCDQISPKIEDFLWLGLTSILNRSNTSNSISLSSLLEAFYVEMKSYGPEYFDANKSNSMMYFKILLICQQFEAAIDYLIQRNLLVEATHFSVALVHYGILFSDSQTYATIIKQYIQSFVRSNLKQAVEYVSLIRDDASRLDLFKDLLFDSSTFEYLIGSLSDNGNRIEGILDQYLVQEQVVIVVRKAAETLKLKGQQSYALDLYLSIGDIFNVISIFKNQLSQVLSPPHPERSFWLQKAIDFTKKYVNDNYVLKALMKDQSLGLTFQLLLNLSRFFDLYTETQYQQALEFIDSQAIIPTRQNSVEIQEAVDTFTIMDSSIKSQFHQVALAYMTCVVETFQQVRKRKESNQQLFQLQERAKTLITFVGLLKYTFPSDLYSHLAAKEIMLLNTSL